ncbi:STAS domain-containing protein [Amycolatopsis rubida]|uniref:Anti-anti-sigma factor n=1 Tax=Amycolatopsis rubida TaxID=112413 RepID=A0A1I5LQC6_9PSEU|nr:MULTISPECIES: STAS domain-containing protein [Amycolatopsis]MYW93527.1 STAS domain-containing protein [Amycolatopsis rubida]NEC58514.1 STAS domain-containing protein [Amycolatopsis rubida]OAP25443.1 Anti-sigma-F factor antagonist RsfB [Amycolatopsis sp. M39]SFO98971.1 anti-anti-sigma factor [Amycolatopsis rubida]
MHSNAPPLSLTVVCPLGRPVTTLTRTAKSTVVSLAGDLDAADVRRLRRIVSGELGLRPPALLVDLTDVPFCSARVLKFLAEQADDARAVGVRFAVVAQQRAVLRPLALLGLDRVLPVVGSLDEAVLNARTRRRTAQPIAPPPWLKRTRPLWTNPP